MPNNYAFREQLPIAPLKIAALESCKDLAKKVDDYIVSFRQNDIKELEMRQENLHYRG